MARITIVGTGYVGLATGVSFAEMGHDVVCIDTNSAKIALLQAGKSPIYEPGIEVLIGANLTAGRLRFTTDYADGLREAEFVFIAVGTPQSANGRAADVGTVYAAATSIAENLPAAAIIVNKSTCPMGTAGKIGCVMDATRPELAPWMVVSNPEFVSEGSAIYECLHPARIVLGSQDEAAAAAVARLYESLDCPIVSTDFQSAEMIKYASNAFLATRISFINEVARICDALGADICTVATGMGLDPRIGPSFLEAGLGYGGSCFPKDVAALRHEAEMAGLHPQLLEAVTDINDDQRRWAVDLLAEHLGELHGATIAVWGLTFKPGTDDLREAPAVDIVQRLMRRGALIRAYDPVAGPSVRSAGLPAVICDTALEAVAGADALLIATKWTEFTLTAPALIAERMRGDLLLDGRNCLDPETVAAAGLTYVGVGRPSPHRRAGSTYLAAGQAR